MISLSVVKEKTQLSLLKIDESFKKLLTTIKKSFDWAGPLSIPLFHFAFCFLLYAFFRLVFVVLYWGRVSTEPGFWKLFFIGLRIDGIITCYLLGLLALLFTLLPKVMMRFLRYPLAIWGATILAIAVGMEFATISFLEEYDLRPDRIFFEYLKYPKEIFSMVVMAKPFSFVFLVFLTLYSWFVFFRFNLKNIESYNAFKWWQRLLLLPFVCILLFLGARSSFGHRPANISTAAFSNNNLVNELTLNSTYSLFYAIYRTRHEVSPTAIYGKMTLEEAVSEVQKHVPYKPEDAIPSNIPFLHKQKSGVQRSRPANVVIFLQESLGAEYVGALGGMPLTPELDKLSKEGLWFTQLYATGTRTVRGIEATATGFLPTPGSSVVKLGLSRRDFFTAGALFKKYGHNTMFIYGGMANFDEMRSFFMGNGFQEIYDEPTFKNPIHKGVWGVSDEDLVIKANEIFKEQKRPFFALMLSTSNHSPFDFPEGRIELYEQPAATMHNAMKFADYSIGKLFELAKKEDYYKDTIFLVMADHNTRVYGDEFVPVHKFHIPGVLIGPGIPKENYNKVASQIDMLPTILHFSGLDTVHPMIGRDLMALPEEVPGRAVMQYAENHGYMLGDQIVVHRRYKEPSQFRYDFESKKLIPSDLNADFQKEAYAHAMLPWLLYEKQLYRLPAEDNAKK